MKKSIIILLALLFLAQISSAGIWEITPIKLNYKNVVAVDNTIIAMADFGSILISKDNGENWEQKRIFKGGIILDIFINSDRYIAFNDRGEIAASIDGGMNWSIAKKLSDSILSVVEYPNGYFLRMRDKIIMISHIFEQTNSHLVNSPYLNRITLAFTPNYYKAMLYADGKFVVEFDSSNFIRYDLTLTPVDTLNLNDHFDLSNYRAGYNMIYDSSYIYIMYIYKETGLQSSIYRTSDFVNVEKYIDCGDFKTIYDFHEGNFILIDRTVEENYVDKTRLSEDDLFDEINAFTNLNDKQIVVGNKKLIEIFDMKDSTLKVVSDYSDISLYIPPHRIDEDSYFFHSSRAAIYRSDNGGVTIFPTVNKSSENYDKLLNKSSIREKFYDSESRKLYLLGEHYKGGSGDFMWLSNDMGETFDSIRNHKIVFRSNTPFFRNAHVKSEIQKSGNELIFVSGYLLSPQDTIFSSICSINTDGTNANYFNITGLTIDYVYKKDSDTYFAHSCDPSDSTSNVVFTSNSGENWEFIHKYPINETIGDVYVIDVKGRKYLALTHYDYSDFPVLNALCLDVVDMETNQFVRIASWGNIPDPSYGEFGIAVDSDGDNAFFSFQDTLFVVNDLFNKKSWNYYLLPEGGRIARPLKKYGDKFYCIYIDNDNPYELGMHWIEPLDSLVIAGVEENEITDYLYTYPPFPNPARNSVKAMIFWDTQKEIDNEDDFEIYNGIGEKISGIEKITIEQIDTHSAYVIWICAGVNAGLYFIHVKRGDATRTIPVVVNR